MISNIWNHPNTSIAGALVAIMTIGGVLSQQGITLGHAGTGTVIALVGGICAALLGLLSRDPAAAPAGAPSKLGILMLCALTISGTLPVSGCNGVTVAQDIVNWAPGLQSAVQTVGATVSMLAPADAPIFTAATIGFDAASNLVIAGAKAYLANPSAGVLAQLQTQITTFQANAGSALLTAARIVDPASQTLALAAINGVATIVNVIFGLVMSISGKTAQATMSAMAAPHLAELKRQILDQRSIETIARHYDEPNFVARMQVNGELAQLSMSEF